MKISEAQQISMDNYEPATAPALQTANAPPPAVDAASAFMRCPMPPMTRSVDAQRQFYVRQGVPSMRMLTPPTTL